MSNRPKGEQGFALLLVFAMASIIAITLYFALPRVAFESERDREALLIERGEQYSRAIQLYVRKTKRFPAKMEDLENTNGVRFLRRRYTDPMTGKDEWRLIHAGPGGVLIDSLIQKTTKKEEKVVDNFITDLGPVSGALPADGNVNPALRHRPSDQAGAPGNPNTAPAAGGTPPAQTPPGPTPPGTIFSAQPLAPASATSASTATSSSGISVLPSFGTSAPQTVPLPAAVSQQINNPNGVLPGGLPGAVPGALPGGAPNNASALIQGLLTSPRPGGLAGVNGAQTGATQQQTIGGGIAGVASNFKGQAIKIYHDQDEFPKWEFVYDVSKDATMNPAANLPQAAPAPGTPIGGTAPAAGGTQTGLPATASTPAGTAPAPPVATPPQ